MFDAHPVCSNRKPRPAWHARGTDLRGAELEGVDVYDPRTRPWYIAAKAGGPAPPAEDSRWWLDRERGGSKINAMQRQSRANPRERNVKSVGKWTGKVG